MSEQYPLHDVYLNTKTHCTIDEAIGMLLNLMYLPKEFIQISDEERHNYEEHIWSLQEVLDQLRTELVNEYTEAKIAKKPEDVLEEKLQAIKEFDNDYIKKARTYLLSITDEIAKGTLRVDGHNSITLQSLHDWASENYKISILEISEAGTASVTPRKKTISKEDQGLSKTKTQNFYLTFVCLLKAFVAKYPTGKFGNVKKDSVNGVEKTIVSSIKPSVLANHLSTLISQSDSTIEKQINEAIGDVIKFHPDIFEKVS